MAFRVQFSPKSVEDLEAIVEYYFAANEKAAEEIYRLIIFRAESLEELAERGRVVPEMSDEGIRKYRELIEGNFRIIYRINEKIVVIIRIIDSRQLLEMKLE
jgi:toxin ParE1/3/4